MDSLFIGFMSLALATGWPATPQRPEASCQEEQDSSLPGPPSCCPQPLREPQDLHKASMGLGPQPQLPSASSIGLHASPTQDIFLLVVNGFCLPWEPGAGRGSLPVSTECCLLGSGLAETGLVAACNIAPGLRAPRAGYELAGAGQSAQEPVWQAGHQALAGSPAREGPGSAQLASHPPGTKTRQPAQDMDRAWGGLPQECPGCPA
jgi:hypothetical protein